VTRATSAGFVSGGAARRRVLRDMQQPRPRAVLLRDAARKTTTAAAFPRAAAGNLNEVEQC
jgi:hypothetical protein